VGYVITADPLRTLFGTLPMKRAHLNVSGQQSFSIARHTFPPPRRRRQKAFTDQAALQAQTIAN
jgi:hypothetical protein